MKVKCFIRKVEEIEIEVPNKFRKLAIRHTWEDPTITDEDYEQLVEIIEEAVGYPFLEEYSDEGILGVESAENGLVMLEA